ncbi:MAG: hypothetical protein IPO77_12930 [Acidobacteria bacterium]|nr:hypothetical protein [Acidobacteriota bacterium]
MSRPLPKEKPPGPDAPLNDLLTLFAKVPADEQAYKSNLEDIKKAIQEEFKFKLSENDQKSLEYVYNSFREDGLDISYRMDGGSWGYNYFPTLQEILAGTDLNGNQGNFLASREDYDFLREFNRRNLLIPIVGDFGGNKALVAIGDYLRSHGLTVTAYYTSNVEQYLFGSDSFNAWANNVKRLPVNDKSLFIRAIAGRVPHPARMPGHRLATLLQQMTVFIKDFNEGLYPSYNDLITTHYIFADKP